MKKNNRPIIVLTVVMIVILIINIMSAQNTCNYIIEDTSLKCIIIGTFGITDIFYFIGKNLYILIYVIILLFILKKRKKETNYSEMSSETEVTENIATNQNKRSSNEKYINSNYSAKEIGLFTFIICIIITFILLIFLLNK